jgi:hypothetical protein
LLFLSARSADPSWAANALGAATALPAFRSRDTQSITLFRAAKLRQLLHGVARAPRTGVDGGAGRVGSSSIPAGWPSRNRLINLHLDALACREFGQPWDRIARPSETSKSRIRGLRLPLRRAASARSGPLGCADMVLGAHSTAIFGRRERRRLTRSYVVRWIVVGTGHLTCLPKSSFL